MRRMWNFFKSKAFYLALGTGLVAFATLLAIYNYSDISKELTKEQSIDLNQPVEMDEGADEKNKNQNNGQNNSVAANTNPVKKSEAGDDKKNYETSEASDDEKNAMANNNEIGTKNDVAEQDAAEQDADNTTEEQAASNEAAYINQDDNQPDTGDNWSNETTDIVAGLEYDGQQLLIWPVIGNVILPFSMDTTVYFQTLDMYKCNPGMLIQGEEGSNVQAAYEGVVTAIDDTKEYGTVIRVNLGNGYEAVYGQVMNVCVRVGDTVSMAQNIAEIAPASSYYSEEGPHLYFAISKDGEPVNPMGLIQ